VELPRLEPVFQKYRDKGFTIVAVERTQDTGRAKKFIADNKLTYTFLENGKDDAEVVRRVFGVTMFPTSFLLDRAGRVMYTHGEFRPGDEAELERRIEKLLGS
jgi:cytochrome c biogenesis protein CcmG, thiol:disulfide interchange protein DsbE